MRILAELPTWATDIGAAAAIVAAVVAAVYAVARTPVARPFRAIGRWAWSTAGKVWRLIVADPIGRWLTKLIGDAVESSPLSTRVSQHMESEDAARTEWSGRLDAIDERLDAGTERMAALEEGHGEIKGMLADTLAELKAGNPEVRP